MNLQEIYFIKVFYDRQKLKELSSLFNWWCPMVQGFQCHPELPALLLKVLVTAVEMLVTSRKVDFTEKAEINKRNQEITEEATNGEEKESEGSHDELENISRVDDYLYDLL